ncbi:MAG: hypothetical protein MHMPM18_004830 [Marteilia pararefringens]
MPSMLLASILFYDSLSKIFIERLKCQEYYASSEKFIETLLTCYYDRTFHLTRKIMQPVKMTDQGEISQYFYRHKAIGKGEVSEIVSLLFGIVENPQLKWFANRFSFTSYIYSPAALSDNMIAEMDFSPLISSVTKAFYQNREHREEIEESLTDILYKMPTLVYFSRAVREDPDQIMNFLLQKSNIDLLLIDTEIFIEFQNLISKEISPK